MNSVRHALVRAAATVATTGLAVGGLTLVGASPSSAALSETHYGFSGTAYGTRVLSRGSGLESGRSAFSWIGCTRLAGRTAENHIADVTVPDDSPVIHVSGVQSDNETYRQKAKGIDGASRSTNTIAEVGIGGSGAPLLTLQGLTTTSTAWATTGGDLKARNDVTLSDISLTGITDPNDGGPLSDLFDALDGGIDTVFQALDENAGEIAIPGLGVISTGYDRHVVKARYAAASSFVLRVTLYGTNGVLGGGDDTLIGIGRTWARVTRDVPAAVMSGRAYGATADLLGGLADIGELGAQLLPCGGTAGKVFKSPTAALDLASAGQLVASGIEGRTWGVQSDSGVAEAWAEGSVSNLTLGPLEIRGIVGRVNLKQNRNHRMVRQDIRGSSIGQILLDGEPQGSFDPATADQIPPMEIPGVGSIEFFVKERTHRGMKVSAVVINAIDGTPGISSIRLGNAQARLKRY